MYLRECYATLRHDYLRAEIISDERNNLEQTFLRTPAGVTYNSSKVLASSRVHAPMMAAAIAPILIRNDGGK